MLSLATTDWRGRSDLFVNLKQTRADKSSKERTIMKTTHRRMLVAIICAFALLASVAGVAAQAPQERRPAPPVAMQNGGGVGTGTGMFAYSGQGDNTFVFVSSEMSFDGKLVKGAPYSAQVLTESVQTLADGNRIVRRSNAAVYRDSEGRTRREQTINAVGAFAS